MRGWCQSQWWCFETVLSLFLGSQPSSWHFTVITARHTHCGTPYLTFQWVAGASWEDIQARSGATEQEVLSKKLSFKKGMKPEKKIDEMVPMIKELRSKRVWGGSGREV